MKDFSYITSSHPEFIENLYQDFLQDPNSVDPELKMFFEGFDFAIGNTKVKTNGSATATGAGPAKSAATDGADPIGIGWKKEPSRLVNAWVSGRRV